MVKPSTTSSALTSMGSLQVLICLIVTYFIFAILLNSVGTVILQSIETFKISKTAASALEGFKDLPIALVSFFVASYLPRFGFKPAMLLGMGCVAITCALMPLFSSFFMTKMLFMSVGISFALIKVSVYALLGLISATQKHHASNMNIVEGCFMVGVLSGYWLFAHFIDPQNPASNSWLNVYWLLALGCLLNMVLIGLTQFPKLASPENTTVTVAGNEASEATGITSMLSLLALPFVLMFILCAFFYVLIEQGIGTWLPTFNKDVIGLANNLSVQITSIFAACLAIGRLGAGVILRRMHWFTFLAFCITAMAILMLSIIPLTWGIDASLQITQWHDIPAAAFALPLIGLFMAPIYPAINSVVLTALPKHKHASMTGLIIIFSALGGTLGSLITGTIFDYFNGQTAFYFMLIPMSILLFSLFMYRLKLEKTSPDVQ
ncbi:MFS transporter [Aestuariibacter sp. AA17]|uniref:MFS transporter n=1 Tax=Fluctibacter corallii TaxID=2984329 RepID=A0ABT3A451_9ALTE|nr:MFS transporter [Aestuariibacter sp. AA17]MCV2883450.1 MFS transporter [Aestuariibacter sp. AA17]